MTRNPEHRLGPTPERLAKAGHNVEAFTAADNVNHAAIRMLDGHVLERLASRSVITGDQYHAGMQFYADWYHSGLAASGVIDPAREVVDGRPGSKESDRKLDAMTRWKRAVQAVGLIHCQVLTSVVLNEEDLAVYGMRRYRQQAKKLARLAATVALQNALAELDNHYYGQRRNRQRAAHAEDYRPGIVVEESA